MQPGPSVVRRHCTLARGVDASALSLDPLLAFDFSFVSPDGDFSFADSMWSCPLAAGASCGGVGRGFKQPPEQLLCFVSYYLLLLLLLLIS